METVALRPGHACPWPELEVDAFRVLDHKLRNTAKALTSWSAKHVGEVSGSISS
jgi:hypothetical protein